MSVPNPSSGVPGVPPGRLAGCVGFAALLLGIVSLASTADSRLAASDPPARKPKETLVGGKPLFAGWPQRKPDAVIVFSGQTYGFLQPCGCSRPQIGGLERRAMLIDMLKQKGWPVAGVDLGDLVPEKSALEEQGRLKYVTMMNALREMGYYGVGVGKTELQSDLISLLGAYAWQKERRPFTLAGNVEGVVQGKAALPRVQMFPPPNGATRPVVEDIEVGKVGDIPVGVAGVVGAALDADNKKQKWTPLLAFPNENKAIANAEAALAKHNLKPRLNVLIYQGEFKDAAAVARAFPSFQVILCQALNNAPPPLQPRGVAGNKHPKGQQTLIVEVGSKGQHVGVLGAFKNTKGGFDFYYQLVPLGEEFLAPAAPNTPTVTKTLEILEDYAKAVQKANLLPQYPRVPHPAQIQAAGFKPPVLLTYVGSNACKACHAAEFNQWKTTPHSRAMNTLVNIAKRPSLRQFDGECVKCHSVGFDYQSGCYDPKNKEAKNKLLFDVGCENCHGPGSGHVSQPKRKDLLPLLSPWKQPGAAKLPNAAFMKKMADTPDLDRGKIAIPPAQQFLINNVQGICMKCHDHESDPHFDFYKNWPKIDHSGLAPKGGGPAVPPAPKK